MKHPKTNRNPLIWIIRFVYCVLRWTLLSICTVNIDRGFVEIAKDDNLGHSDGLVKSGPVKFINTLRPRQDGRHFPDDIFKCIFLKENVWILIKMSLKFVPKGPINNIPALVQIMAWRRSGDKPLFEPMMVSLLTHICVNRLQWVKNVVFKHGTPW